MKNTVENSMKPIDRTKLIVIAMNPKIIPIMNINEPSAKLRKVNDRNAHPNHKNIRIPKSHVPLFVSKSTVGTRAVTFESFVSARTPGIADKRTPKKSIRHTKTPLLTSILVIFLPRPYAINQPP